MELKFVLGKSGKARTDYCIDEMLKAPLSQKIIYIVPEQFTLESEKALTSKRKSLLNIDVVSFRRLYFHITARVGKPKGEFLDDEGRNMILKRLLEQLKPEFFCRSQGKQGFLDSLERIIGEFYRFRLKPELLKENINKIEETEENRDSVRKLRELSKIYAAYDSFTAEKYISADGILDFVADKIKETDLFENCFVYIDGFNSFTAQEYAVISEILAYSDKVTLTLCLDKPVEIMTNDEKEALTDPFYETKASYVKLCGIFKGLYPAEGKITFKKAESREKLLPEFDFLEKNFFELKPKVYGKTENIRVFSAVNKRAEVSAVCDEICSLISKGMRCRDIGIILCSPAYGSVLNGGLKAREIPDFADSRTALSSHPLSRFIISLVNIAAYEYKNRDVFSLLKTGYTSIEQNKIYRMEKYVLEYGIEGYRWEQEIKDSYFEEIRKSLVNMVSPLKKFSAQKKYVLSEINKALFEALELSGFYKKYLKTIEETEDEILSSKYKQLWEQAVDTFNKAEEFLGDTEVTLEEYGSIISSGFAKKSAASIPMYQDNIIIGDMSRSRLPRVKALFVLGANKGSLPQRFEDTGLISDRERALMKEYGMEIAADTKEQLSLEYLKIYQMMTKPTHRLYVSYALGTNTGEKLERAEIADNVIKMFEIEPKIYEEEVISPKNKTPFEPVEKISAELMKSFIGDELTLSSSKLDNYVKCPFSYYLNYILNLQENRIFEINPADKGNIMHGIMERLFRETENLWEMSEEEIYKRIGEIMPEVVAENLYNIVDEDKKIPENFHKLKYFINKIEKTADTSVMAGLKQLKRGSFRPSEFEVSFGGKESGSLPPVKIAEGISLVGKIDRVDIYEEGDNVYVKITDYKSSAQTLDMTEIYNGLKLQLLLYLSAYTAEKQKTEKGKRIYHPAGLMYFSFSDPIINENDFSAKSKTAESIKMGKFSPVGIVSEKGKEAVDNGEKSFKFTGSLKRATEEQLKDLMDKAGEISAKTGEKIKSGEFPVKPYEYKGRNGCDYCPYNGICEIDTDKTRSNIIKEPVVMQGL